MNHQATPRHHIADEVRDLRERLQAAEETLRAIRANEVDALVVGPRGQEQIYTLEGADQSYRVFVEVMPEGAATLSADGTILFCNRQFAALARNPLEKTIGASIFSFVWPEDEGNLRATLWEALTAAPVKRQFQLRTGPDSSVPVLLTAAPLSVDGVPSVCVVVTDLTEHEARAAAEAESQAKDRFLAVLSHELRTPLGAVLLWAKLARSGRMSPEELQDALEKIERSADAQRQLIEDLLDVSAMVSGKLRLNLRELDPLPVLEAALEAVRPAARDKHIELNVAADETGWVLADAGRLQQIVWNLLNNAVKFTDGGGRVDVRLRRVGSMLQIEVADTGCGIDLDFLPHVFDRFRQADSSLSRAHGGLGLGLSICKQLVELHGGTIRAHSDGPARGAVFSVELPVVPAPATADGRRPPLRECRDGSPSSLSLQGVRVLVAEDEADTRAAIRLLLERHGAQVTDVPSAAHALAAVGDKPPHAAFDVLVSDIGMPGLDGCGLLHALRIPGAHGDADATLPAIALTAYAREEDRAKVVAAGFQRHLPKPIEPDDLIAAIAHLARRRARRND